MFEGFSYSLSTLDFSQLSQTGWVAHRLSAQREAISRWLHIPLSGGGDEARSNAPKGVTLRRLARFLGSVSCPFGTVSRSATRAHETRRFQPARRLRRLFACWSPTPTRKKYYGHPRNL